MTFRAYMQNVEKLTGKSREELYKMAGKKGFVKGGKIVATHAQLLGWLKEEVGLGHVRANFIILYLRLRTKDPKLTTKSRAWAYDTGYKD